jgi:hypothetical protein
VRKSTGKRDKAKCKGCAGVSFVHGVTGLLSAHHEIGDLYWNFLGEL